MAIQAKPVKLREIVIECERLDEQTFLPLKKRIRDFLISSSSDLRLNCWRVRYVSQQVVADLYQLQKSAETDGKQLHIFGVTADLAFYFERYQSRFPLKCFGEDNPAKATEKPKSQPKIRWGRITTVTGLAIVGFGVYYLVAVYLLPDQVRFERPVALKKSFESNEDSVQGIFQSFNGEPSGRVMIFEKNGPLLAQAKVDAAGKFFLRFGTSAVQEYEIIAIYGEQNVATGMYETQIRMLSRASIESGVEIKFVF